jgi:hypothetical protein
MMTPMIPHISYLCPLTTPRQQTNILTPTPHQLTNTLTPMIQARTIPTLMAHRLQNPPTLVTKLIGDSDISSITEPPGLDLDASAIAGVDEHEEDDDDEEDENTGSDDDGEEENTGANDNEEDEEYGNDGVDDTTKVKLKECMMMNELKKTKMQEWKTQKPK